NLFDGDVPGLLQVFLRVGPKGGERLGALKSRHLRKYFRHDARDRLVLTHAHDGHEVPLARDGIHLVDAIDARQRARGLGNQAWLHATQHDRRDHARAGKGGTFNSQSPARWLDPSTSSRMSRAQRTVRVWRSFPSRK